MRVAIIDQRYLTFKCPGCGDIHSIPVDAGRWTWNGDVDRPTVSPSLLVTSGHYIERLEPRYCWCQFNAERVAKGEEPTDNSCYRCHSFIREGQIQFLPDCSHALSGQTVDLPEITDVTPFT